MTSCCIASSPPHTHALTHTVPPEQPLRPHLLVTTCVTAGSGRTPRGFTVEWSAYQRETWSFKVFGMIRVVKYKYLACHYSEELSLSRILKGETFVGSSEWYQIGLSQGQNHTGPILSDLVKFQFHRSMKPFGPVFTCQSASKVSLAPVDMPLVTPP